MLHNRVQDQQNVEQARAEQARTEQTHFTLAERRNTSRVPVIKSAKIVAGNAMNQTIYNCLVLDESATGVLVDLGAVFPLPEEMILQMNGGATYKARRCWAVGTKAGLAFNGPHILSAEAVQMLHQLGEFMHVQGLPVTLAALKSKRYFDNDEIRSATEAAEAAYQRLEMLLNG